MLPEIQISLASIYICIPKSPSVPRCYDGIELNGESCSASKLSILLTNLEISSHIPWIFLVIIEIICGHVDRLLVYELIAPFFPFFFAVKLFYEFPSPYYQPIC
jgi:hypothetical protein